MDTIIKCGISSIFLFFILTQVHAQDIFTVSFNSVDLKLDELKKSDRKLKFEESYKLRIEGINSAHIKTVINPKSFSLQSNISEPLKVLFPGMSTNFDISKAVPDSITIFDSALIAFDYLHKIDSLSKVVYEATKFSPSPDATKKLINHLLPIENEGETLQKTEESILLLTYLFEKYSVWFDKYLERNDVDDELFNIGLKLQSMKNVIEKNDFLGQATFLEKSMKAKSEMKTTGFKALKDGVDLQISIIDTYKKDTIYKGEIEFINYKKWSFDFSTGFIFNQLVDVPYYLGPASDEKKQILEEDYSRWDIAIGGFAHLTYKMSGFLSFGPQVGIGISILDAKPKYALGAGFLLGRKGKVSVNGGVAFGKVKILSGQLDNINGQYFLPESATSIPTFDRMEASPYFSIAYNLTKKSF